ncbi:hypothetical protein [Pseudoxanthomonas japonensis]|uniref:hypothetical protein n=1 Tax=Pseudoxanthomonas japonensis TaxID=69284 RepID=UPI001BCBB253|nr:hypothetical protein [Pseudoxanthomonas japonensis]
MSGTDRAKAYPPRRTLLLVGCGMLLAMSLLPASARAQAAQTPAGAQEFLGKVLGQGTSWLSVDRGKGWNRVDAAEAERCMWTEEFGGFFAGMQRVWKCTGRTSPSYLSDDDSRMWVDVGVFIPRGAVPEGECKTRIQVDGKGSVYREFKGRYDGKAAEFTAWSGPQQGPFLIDWSKVAGTTNNGREVHLKGIAPGMFFLLPSEELAVRFAYAMEFLRLNCDATAGTGF